MRFYGRGIVWDKDRDKKLCKFNADGYLDTDNQRTIKILVAMNFKQEPEKKIIIEEAEAPKETKEEIPGSETAKAETAPTEDLEITELKKKATEMGIEFSPNIGKGKLMKRILEKEDKVKK